MYPFMADLPISRRTIEEPPFSSCGIDLLGPVDIKQGRQRHKRWIALFTCLTIRAVHLEVVQSPDTDSLVHKLITQVRE